MSPLHWLSSRFLKDVKNTPAMPSPLRYSTALRCMNTDCDAIFDGTTPAVTCPYCKQYGPIALTGLDRIKDRALANVKNRLSLFLTAADQGRRKTDKANGKAVVRKGKTALEADKGNLTLVLTGHSESEWPHK